jgi:hypothetical protein
MFLVSTVVFTCFHVKDWVIVWLSCRNPNLVQGGGPEGAYLSGCHTTHLLSLLIMVLTVLLCRFTYKVVSKWQLAMVISDESWK